MLRTRSLTASLAAVVVLAGLASAGPATAAATPDRGSATSYKVQKIGGSVVRWNPCEAIHYRVNVTYAPAGSLADTKVAVARVAAETEMTFVYDGPTSAIPTRTGEQTDGLTIAWARRGSGPGRSNLLTGGSSVGVGGWSASYVVAPQGGAVSGVHIRSGFVVVDTVSNKLPAGFADTRGGTRGELLEHELGHAVGLEHVSDKSQLMYRSLGSHSSFGAGDKAGLRKVGRSAGCTT